MYPLYKHLRNIKTLQVLFIIALPLLILSKWSVEHWNLVLLDGISDAETARTLLVEMTHQQVQGHLWFTSTIDVILPFAAAGFFASAILVSFKKYGPYLATLALLAIPLDLSEGVIQVLALTNNADFLDVKSYSTPIKKACYDIGFLASVAGLIQWLYLKIKSKVAQPSDR